MNNLFIENSTKLSQTQHPTNHAPHHGTCYKGFTTCRASSRWEFSVHFFLAV